MTTSNTSPHWFSNVEQALVVNSKTDITWHHETDLVIVGYGAAGASAALEGRESGLDVIVLDRFAGGGASVKSGGVVYAGGGTKVQESLGEQDSPQAMFDYLNLETQGVVKDETLMRFCEQSAQNLDWLMSHGVKFSGPVYKKKTSYPNVKYFLYHSDNSLLPSYRGEHPPAARGHRGVIKNGNSAVNLGGALFWPMRESAKNLGVQVDTQTEARQLIVDKHGRVLGLKALQLIAGSDAEKRHKRNSALATGVATYFPNMLPGGKSMRKLAQYFRNKVKRIEENEREVVFYRARSGVVLSAGGFIFNRKMVKHYCPKYLHGLPLGTHADDGSGIRLGESAGGATKLMENATAWRFINPPLAWSKGIIVNQQGARFVNESSYGATIGEAMVERNNGKAWLILDSALVKQAWREISPGKVLPFQQLLAALNHIFVKKKFKTTQAMCDHYNFDLATIEAEIANYARVANGEVSDAFHKTKDDAVSLQGPFHVIDISLAQHLLPCTVLTMGGLDVDERSGEVVDANKNPIPGLYAAGRTAVGIPSNLYMSGLSLADCVFSGRRAAKHAAEQHTQQQ
ncbi:MAG: FAD-binding protein [Glaciecola sp.]|nr:FAD-binding protein [Glaciecola sp.]MDG1817004.1 FAD-binding protein [Glaciecola sp.]MDG2099456.1 FAD-binding protein [Glaciecola sp.]